MGRIISFLTMVVVGFVVILFSITNRDPVPLDFWPLPFSKEVPVYAIVIASAMISFISGGIVAWFSAGRSRRRARLESRRAHNLEKDLSTLNEHIDELERIRREKA